MQEKSKEIRELLAHVTYPGTSENIIALDMVQQVKVDGHLVSFRLIFQHASDPFAPALKKRCESLLSEHGYTAVIEPLFVHDLERPLSLERVHHIIAISSGKGGVGKSTVASNLAIALVQSGYQVGLIDADIFGPSIPKMFDAEGARPYMVDVDGHQRIEPVERYGVKLLSVGFFVEPDAATVWRGPMASSALKQMLEAGNWGELDYLLIDLPPGTSDIHLTLVQSVALTGAIVVSTPQQVALADAVKGINMFRSPGIGVPVLGIVENMAWFTPEELPENRYYLFGKEGAKQLALASNLPLLGQIPIVQGIMEGGESGRPVLLDGGIAATAFRELARQVIAAAASSPGAGQRVKITRK
ncbi:MAG: Mrp/NBP35 family ATP-binding protein [Odoribacteraceae bacterium]|jgi:ATP-binding protein involved in chromosome partitioning|nr:Mrp/NBP35 family ATP-binding protein [Odoribacteraceae bacterium]